MKTYRGSPAAARNYVESGRSRADDYYLAEGDGVAARYVASPGGGVRSLASLSGGGYESWVAGVDPDTGEPKGRLRSDEAAVRFVEVVVNGPKSWSLAAELHPEISAAYDAAQDRAAAQIIAWLARHATTRVGSRGAQIQVPLQEIEAVTVRHHTSRAVDPHRHLHLQINARVFAEDGWRGLHTIGVRDSLDAINGIGHAAVMTDPDFRAALASHGFTLDPGTGEVRELAEFVGPFSARAAQIGRNIDRYETEWRAANRGREPGPALLRAWDARAWADARPDKIVPHDGAELTRSWVQELYELGYRDSGVALLLDASPVGSVDREEAVGTVLSRLAAPRSGWNVADIRGEVEQLIARTNIVTDASIRGELAEDLTARTAAACVPLLDRVGLPEHIRALTSSHVLEVEADLTARLAARADTAVTTSSTRSDAVSVEARTGLDTAQQRVVTALSGDGRLVVVEGAAGAGKTTVLAAARTRIEAGGARLVVVTPTLKAATVATTQLGTSAFSAAWLIHQHGFRWNGDGIWRRLTPGASDSATGPHGRPLSGADNHRVFTGPKERATLRCGDLLMVDEAGMLDQDTARALLRIADEADARLAFVGDRHQLSAVGRGGVLELAARWAAPEACLTLDTIHRFVRISDGANGTRRVVADEQYAQLSLAMRAGTDPAATFDALLARGQIRVHDSDTARIEALAAHAAAALAKATPAAVAADTRDQVAALNAAIRDRMIAAGHFADQHVAITAAGQRIGVGDRVATRKNNTELGVANRDTWTVTDLLSDGGMRLTDSGGGPGERVLPAHYVREHVELAYASTVHGLQGDTVTTAHVAVGEQTSAASAYVGMTRGRENNTAHLIADTIAEAREQWVAVFARDRADLGPAHAAETAAQEAARYAPLRPVDQIWRELRRAWTVEQDRLDELTDLERQREPLADVVGLITRRDEAVSGAKQTYKHARAAAEPAIARAAKIEAAVTAHTEQIATALRREWDAHREAARAAAQVVLAGSGRLGQRRGAMNRATDELSQWSITWQPYLPAMPTRTGDIARFAAWFSDDARIRYAFEQHARAAAELALPDHARAHAAADAAVLDRDHAADAYHAVRSRFGLKLSYYGDLRHLPDPAGELAELDSRIAHSRSELDAAHADVHAVLAEPCLRTLPTERISTERDRWRADHGEQTRERGGRPGQFDADNNLGHAWEHDHHSRDSVAQDHAPDRSFGLSW